jgi:hypothetical protein
MKRLLVVLGLLVWPAVASAQPAERNAEALRLGREALDAYQRNDWAAAYSGFSSAEALTHSPVFILYMARARRNSGALLDARDLYGRVVAEELDAAAPEPWRTAVTDAGVELAELARRIPTIAIEVRALAPGESVVVDGKVIAAERLGSEIELEPGQHRVALRRVDAEPIEKVVTLIEGARRVVVTLETPPVFPPVVATPPRPPPPKPVAPPTRDAAPRERGNPYGTAAIITGLVGVAGVAVGSVAGIVALGKASDAKRGCEDDVCPEANEQHRDMAYDYGALSTVGFIVGGVGLATSATLFWVMPSFSGRGEFSGVAIGTRY